MENETISTRLSGVRQRTHDSVDKIMNGAESMKERSKEELAQVKEKARMMKHNVDGYIKKNPEKSVLIAAGVGVVVGAIITAALMRRKQN